MGRPSLEVRHGIVDDSTLGSTIEWDQHIVGTEVPVGDLSDLWSPFDPLFRGFDVLTGSIAMSMARGPVWVSQVVGVRGRLGRTSWELLPVKLPLARHLLVSAYHDEFGLGLEHLAGKVQFVWVAELEATAAVFDAVRHELGTWARDWAGISELLPRGSVVMKAWDGSLTVRGDIEGHEVRLASIVETLDSFGLGADLVPI